MSPLLKFPAELLEKILEYVVGGGLIHVKYITADQLTFLTSSYRSPPKNGVFRSAVCQAEESEHQVYVEANSHDQRGPLGQTLEPYVANWMQRHQNCSGHCANDGSNDGGEEKIANLKLMMKTDRVDKVDLRVMATCRQLYERCNVLLWRTNTFSFVSVS